MGNNTASEEVFEVEKVERDQWVKWTVPLVLLLLVLALVTAVTLSERPRIALDSRNIVLCALTALLCTLVAVSLTLMGCAESSRETEQHIRSVATEATTSRNELLRLGQAGLIGNEEISTKTSRFEENQRLLRDELRELKNVIEREHDALRKATESHKQELAKSIGAVTVNQQAMQGQIDGLQQAGELMSEKITVTADNQESLRSTVQGQSELLGDRMSSLAAMQEELAGHVDGLRELTQTVAGDVTNIAHEQATLHETVGDQQVASRESFQAHAEALDAQMSGLATAQEQLESKLNTAAISLTKIADEQASLGGTLRDNTCTLTQKMQIIEQFQHTFQAQVSNVAQASQQMIASIEAMIVEQTSLREKTTVTADDQESLRLEENQRLLQDKLGELKDFIARAHDALRKTTKSHNQQLAKNIRALTLNQQAMQARIDNLQQTGESEKTTVTADDKKYLRSTVKKQSKLLRDRMSDLVAMQEQLRSHVDCLRELAQMLAGNVANIAHEQATLHETVGAQPNLGGWIGNTWFLMASDGLVSTPGLSIQQGPDHCGSLAGPVPAISISNSRLTFCVPDPRRYGVADGEYGHPIIVSWNRFPTLLDS